MSDAVEAVFIIVNAVISGWQWTQYAKTQAPRNLGIAVFVTLLTLAVMQP